MFPACAHCNGHVTIERERIDGVGDADFYRCENCGYINVDDLKFIPRQQVLFGG